MKEDVWVLSRPSKDRTIGCQRPGAVIAHQIRVKQRFNLRVLDGLDLGYLVRGAETIEEVKKGDART